MKPHKMTHILALLLTFLLFSALSGCESYPDGVSQKKTLSYRGGPLPAWQSQFRAQLLAGLELADQNLLLSDAESQTLIYDIRPIELNQPEYQNLKKYLSPYKSEANLHAECGDNSQSLFYKPSNAGLDVFTCDDLQNPIRVWDLRVKAFDGLNLAAYLLVPHKAKLQSGQGLPTFLYFHGHNSGRDEAAFAYFDSYHHALGIEMAKRGFLTLLPQIRSFDPQRPQWHSRWVKEQGPQHPPLLAKMLWDGVLWGEILSQADFKILNVPEVTRTDFNVVVGTSLGSQVALLVGAIDVRYEVTASFGGFYGFEVLHTKSHHACQHLPLLTQNANIMDLALLVPPRRLILGMGEKDKFENGYARSAWTDLQSSLQTAQIPSCAGTPESVLKIFQEHQACSVAMLRDPKAGHEVLPLTADFFPLLLAQ